MDTGSTARVLPASVPGDTTVLNVEEEFKNLLDEPYITVNVVEGRMVAEIVKSPDPDLTWARIQMALDVGHQHGQHAWARVHGDHADEGYHVVTIHFMPDVDG